MNGGTSPGTQMDLSLKGLGFRVEAVVDSSYRGYPGLKLRVCGFIVRCLVGSGYRSRKAFRIRN